MNPKERTSKYEEATRRALDVLLASTGLLVLSPFLALTALLVRASSPGPVIFKQVRVGRNAETFNILKFRTMREDAEKLGGQLTIGSDSRVTRIGAVLRNWKLDELPQLINVLRGEMSIVGPRPEVPRYVDLYTSEQLRVLEVRPGLTDPASVAFRNESEVLANHTDPEQAYILEVMPRKLELNLEYLARRSLTSDVGVIWDTLRAVLRPGSPG